MTIYTVIREYNEDFCSIWAFSSEIAALNKLADIVESDGKKFDPHVWGVILSDGAVSLQHPILDDK